MRIRETCPTACVEANHPGIEHEQWAADLRKKPVPLGELEAAWRVGAGYLSRAEAAEAKVAGSSAASAALVALSRWIDAGNADRDAEAVTWGRLAKITEEAGEVIAAYIGATGQNPRKGVTCDLRDVVEELLDVAVTALGAVEHLTGHDGDALSLLEEKILRVAERAGVIHPCGHLEQVRCCGGCDPGAIEYIRDDGGSWRKIGAS